MPKRHLETFWCIVWPKNTLVFRHRDLWGIARFPLFHAEVPPVQGLIHEQGSVLQSIYQVHSLLLLAAVVAFKWLSSSCWITGMSEERGALSSRALIRWQISQDHHYVPQPGPRGVTCSSNHARAALSLGWQGRQPRVGGPALFTPVAACTGFFKQSGCLHALPPQPVDVIRQSRVDVAFWWRTIYCTLQRGREGAVASCKTSTTAAPMPVVWPDNCGLKRW